MHFKLKILVMALLLFGEVAAQSNDNCKGYESSLSQHFSKGEVDEFLADFANKSCFDGLSEEGRIKAYEMAAKVYLFLGKKEQADSVFVRLLKIKPYYQAPSGEAELLYLSTQYRTKPIASVGACLGMNFGSAVGGASTTTGLTGKSSFEYLGMTPNFEAGIEASMPFGPRSPFGMGLGLYFRRRGYAAENTLFTSTETGSVPYSKLTFKENQSWISVPIYLQATLPIKDTSRTKLNILLQAGLAPEFLVSAGMRNVRRETTDADGVLSDEVLRLDGLRRTGNMSMFLGIGACKDLGKLRLLVQVQYMQTMFNTSVPENRYTNPSLLYTYAFADRGFSMQNISISIGIQRNLFSQKKRPHEEELPQWMRKTTEAVGKVAKREGLEILSEEKQEIKRDIDQKKFEVIQQGQDAKEKAKDKLIPKVPKLPKTPKIGFPD